MSALEPLQTIDTNGEQSQAGSRGLTGPRFLWERKTGRILGRNNIIAGPDGIFLGACGQHWNRDDEEDGVSRIDLQTGGVIWNTPTGSDVNEIARVGEHLLCPTDRGAVFVICATSGNIERIHYLDAAVRSRPLAWQNGAGDWEAIAISAKGTVYKFDVSAQDAEVIGVLDGQVRANPVDVSSEGERAFIATTESGSLVRCQSAEGRLIARAICSVTYREHALSASKTGNEVTGFLHAAPVMERERLYIGFARNSYYSEPPLLCVDLITGGTIWRASQPPQAKIGNCRVTPIVVDSFLIAGFAYSDSLHIFDKEDGTLKSTVKVGPEVFQQWSAPIVYGSNHVLFGRVDGSLSVVNYREHKLVASISLANREIKLEPITDDWGDQPYALPPGKRALGICGTPAVIDGMLIVGTTSGDLFAIELNL